LPPQLFLTEEFSMSDVGAGAAYGLYGTLSTLYGLFLGTAVDWLGVRRSLLLSFLVSAAAKVVIATATNRTVVLAMLYGPLPAAGALGIPVLTIGIRRCTHAANRGFAFGLFYTLMNVAALVSGVAVDTFRLGLKHGVNRSGHGVMGSGMRLLVLLGAVTSLSGAGVALSMREGVRVPDKPVGSQEGGMDGQHDATLDAPRETLLTTRRRSLGPPPGDDEHLLPALDMTDADEVESQMAGSEPPQPPVLPTYRQLLRDPRLWKYLVMCVLTVNLRSIFRHVDATLPKYLIRAFGCSAPTGSIYAINPAIIILLVPLVTAGTTRVKPFDMIRAGGWLSALSPLLVAAWPSYGGVILFIVLLSIGEAIWSPRWYDYTMALAPEGREGAFTALAAAPLFLATLPTGMLSGELLSRMCPASAEAACHPGGVADPNAYCQGGKLWGVIAAVTLASPLGITVFSRWLRPPEDAAQEVPVPEGDPQSPPPAHAPARFDAVADALTGGFSGLRDRLKRVVAGTGRGLAPPAGELLLDGSDDEWVAADGDLHSPLLLRASIT
jgi:POT family proton-dependent oligopeptide transporter